MTTDTTYSALIWEFDVRVPQGVSRQLLRRRLSVASTTLAVFDMSATFLEWRDQGHLTLIVKHRQPQEGLNTLLERVDHVVTQGLRKLQEEGEDFTWQGQLEARVDDRALKLFRCGQEDSRWVFAGRQEH